MRSIYVQWPTFIPQLTPLLTNFTEKIKKVIAALLAGIYYFIDPIGEKLHRFFQEEFPMRSVADSLADNTPTSIWIMYS